MPNETVWKVGLNCFCKETSKVHLFKKTYKNESKRHIKVNSTNQVFSFKNTINDWWTQKSQFVFLLFDFPPLIRYMYTPWISDLNSLYKTRKRLMQIACPLALYCSFLFENWAYSLFKTMEEWGILNQAGIL